MTDKKVVEFTTDKPPKEFLTEYFGCLSEQSDDDEDPAKYFEIIVKGKSE